jgi:arylsulfatase A-like enzyme
MRENIAKRTLLMSTLLAALAVGAVEAKAPGKQRPNVVIIVADDMGYSDPSIYGNQNMSTPAIDSIGREGVKFTNGYVTAPLCSPSRAGLITGRYQQRFGFEQQVYNGALPWLQEVRDETGALTPLQGEAEFTRRGLAVSEQTFGDMFKAAGYRTAVIGKWHLGHAPQFQPNARGFDYSYVFYGNTSLQSTNLSSPDVVSVKVDYHDELPNVAWTREGLNAVRRNGKIEQVDQFLLFRFRDEAVNFINEHKSEPFLLYLPMNAPQPPLQVPSSYFETLRPNFANIAQRAYNGLVLAQDDAIGSVLQALKDNNLEENTIVIFVSDNGSSVSRPGSNAPFRGGKTSTLEGGIRVPFMIRWPGKIKAGSVMSQPVSTLDILPTIAAASGVPITAKAPLDGKNLLPFIRGERADAPHDSLFWKLGPQSAVRRGKWKLWIDNGSKTTRLYDLDADPGETRDLSKQEPAVTNELMAAYNSWNGSLPERAWTTVSPVPRRRN